VIPGGTSDSAACFQRLDEEEEEFSVAFWLLGGQGRAGLLAKFPAHSHTQPESKGIND
jgi:hypothetical protein